MEKQTLHTLLEEFPVIPAVKNDAGMKKCVESESPLVFVLHANLSTAAPITSFLKEHGKTVFLHMDLIEGLAQKEVAVDFLARTTQADGIISTRPNLIRHASAQGLLTVQRYFLLDSISLQNILKAGSQESADLIEVLPGVMPKVIRKLSSTLRVPLVAGGLISDKEDAISALSAGASAISTTHESIWFL